MPIEPARALVWALTVTLTLFPPPPWPTAPSGDSIRRDAGLLYIRAPDGRLMSSGPFSPTQVRPPRK